jgi:hypothetical protein
MASLKKKVVIKAQKKGSLGPGQRTQAKAYETAVFFQETRKKNKAADRYLADIKTNIRNAGYNPDNITMRYDEQGRAASPRIKLASGGPGLRKATYVGGINKANAKRWAAIALKAKTNPSTTGRSTNRKAK